MINRLISITIIFAFVIGCAVNPVTGKRQFMLISEGDEIKMGREYDPQISQMYGVYNDEKLTKYVDDLGQKMVKISHRSNLAFDIKVMDSPVINAFAVPGGYLYITRGILAYLNSEAELAGVMGHEIGHVTARHSASQQSKAQLAQIGLGLGSMFSETFAQYSGLASQATGLLFLKFGRDDETQSDKLGVEYSTKVGYDATHMSNFFNVLDKMSADGGNSLPSFLSTHPNPADRVVKVKQETQKWQQKVGTDKKYVVNRNQYLEQIDGIIYGPDPQQGFVEENVFYHPGLKFQFPTPTGWAVNNLPSQVQMIAPDEQGVMIFKLEPVEKAAQAATTFANETKMTVISNNAITVNGNPAQEIIGTVNTENGALKLIATYIEMDKNVYSFLGYSALAGFSNYEAAFKGTINDFSRLTDQNKINRKPDRIRVKTVAKDMSFADALKSIGVAEADIENHALLNGAMPLTETIKANTRLKMIQKGN